MKKIVALLLICLSAFASENRVVLITGASRGIGLATAELFSEKGFTVYGTLRESSALPSSSKLHFLRVDMHDENSIHSAIQTVIEQEGHLDILINNAAYACVGPIEMVEKSAMQEQMEINFIAPLNFIQAALPSMRQQKKGHIINISSVNAPVPSLFGSQYGASKAALEAASEVLALEVRPFNIAVSIVEPGLVDTFFSLDWGKRELENNPYQETIDDILSILQDRHSPKEDFLTSQSPKEVAEFLYAVIEDPKPKLRYQTSEEAKEVVSEKLIDLTGERYLKFCGVSE